MLTRSGGVERRQIGAIRIHDRTCEIEIASEVAEQFQSRSAQSAPDDIRVRPIEGPSARHQRAFKPRAPRHKGPEAVAQEDTSRSTPGRPARRKAAHAGKGPDKRRSTENGAGHGPRKGKGDRKGRGGG
jgi:ATP-dependent RNA helicase DeaD